MNAARWTPAACPTCCQADARSPIPLRANRSPTPGTSTACPIGRAGDTCGILEAAAHGDLEALLIGGVEAADLADPHAALAAIGEAEFVVSLEVRESEITALADVVFPVAPVAEKAGTFLDWEGRLRSF